MTVIIGGIIGALVGLAIGFIACKIHERIMVKKYLSRAVIDLNIDEVTPNDVFCLGNWGDWLNRQ
jgi:membrane protein DedA with SNARE-associated domain